MSRSNTSPTGATVGRAPTPSYSERTSIMNAITKGRATARAAMANPKARSVRVSQAVTIYSVNVMTKSGIVTMNFTSLDNMMTEINGYQGGAPRAGNVSRR